MKTIDIKCESLMKLPLADMRPFQGNLKTLTNANYEKLKKQILRLGYSEPISIWNNAKDPGDGYYILNGHQRYHTLKAMEEDGYDIPPLPVTLVQASSLKEAKEKVLSLTSQYGEITDEGLYEFMAEADLKMPDLEDLRFPEIDMKHFEESFFTEPVTVDEGDDDVPDVDENKYGVKEGDIWLLGDHRVMCGDSTDRAVVDTLIGGSKADMSYCDPPYGANIVNSSGKLGGDKPFGNIGNMEGKIVKAGLYKPIVGDDTTDTAKYSFEICREISKCLIFWGAQYYAESLPPSSGWIVWDKQTDGSLGDGELAYTNQKKAIRIFQHKWSGMIKASEKNERRVHPTQKPIALAVWCFENYGDPKTVLDLFLGSGSTLIACEKTGRKCFGMEIDPHYCSVIIERWQNLTGKRAVKQLPNGLRELDVPAQS